MNCLRKISLLTLLFYFPVFLKAEPLDSLLKLLETHILEEHLDWADKVNQEIEKQNPENADPRLQAQYYSLKSAYEGRYHRYAEQYEYLDKYFEIAQKLKDPELLAEANLGYASYYEQFSDFKKGLPFFLKALDSYHVLNNEPKIAYLYNKLGLIHYADGNYSLAHTYFFASFVLFNKHISEDKDYPYWIQNCLSNIGLCYVRIGNPRKALAYMKIALEFCKTHDFRKERAIAVIETHLGLAYSKLGNYNMSVYFFNKGIDGCLNPENNEEGHGIESILNLSSVYLKMNRLDMAEKCLSKAYYLMNSHKHEHLLGYYYQFLADTRLAQKDYQNAYKYRMLGNAFEDSVDLVLDKSTYGKQILLYNLEKQKSDNYILQKDIEYKTLINRSVGIITLLVIVIAITIFFSLKKYRERNKKLEDLNTQITAQKRILEELNSKLERINQNREYLMQSIAHDLRTPIGNVISLKSLMEEFVEKGSEGEEYLNMIHSSSTLGLNIIEDILDQSLIEKGKFHLKYTHTNLTQLVNETVSLLEFRWKPKQIQIKLNMGSEQNLDLDYDRIKRVLINILMNAIKFSPRNSEIQIWQQIRNNTCVLGIKDQGIGMSKEMVSQIFEKNTAAGREGLEHEKTIGIGLSIAHSIVEEHGGTIKVESEPNSGSTFYIELPI